MSLLLPLITLSRDRIQAGLLRTQLRMHLFMEHGLWPCLRRNPVYFYTTYICGENEVQVNIPDYDCSWCWFFHAFEAWHKCTMSTKRINYALDNKSMCGTIVKFMCIRRWISNFHFMLFICLCTWPHMHFIDFTVEKNSKHSIFRFDFLPNFHNI